MLPQAIIAICLLLLSPLVLVIVVASMRMCHVDQFDRHESPSGEDALASSGEDALASSNVVIGSAEKQRSDDHSKYIGKYDTPVDMSVVMAVVRDIVDSVKDKELTIVHRYDQLKSITRRAESRIIKMGCHHGQRKLLLTEIEFLTNYNMDLVIYAGSAPCEHMVVLAKMFPKVTFVLIDPNYHELRNVPFNYVYQNTKAVGRWHMQQQQKRMRSSGGKWLKSIKRQLRAKFYKHGTFDLINPSATATLPSKMNPITDAWKAKHYRTFIYDIMDASSKQPNGTKVHIIQDYLTIELCQLLKAGLDIASTQRKQEGKPPFRFGFISDMRSVIEGKYPMEADLVWNDALQIIALKTMRPESSMLKFHPPYMQDDGTLRKHANVISKELTYVKDVLGLDLRASYFSGKYMGIHSSEVYLQAWAGASSSEARLIVHRNDIDKPYMHYDHVEWDNKMFYLKMIRGYGYHPHLITTLKKHVKVNQHSKHFDGCFDCSLEMLILLNYVVRPKCHMDLHSIVAAMDKRTCFKMLKYYKLIEATIGQATKSKINCIQDRHIYAPHSCLFFYFTETINNYSAIIVFRVDGKGNTTKIATVDCNSKKVTGDLRNMFKLTDVDDQPFRIPKSKLELYVRRKCLRTINQHNYW